MRVAELASEHLDTAPLEQGIADAIDALASLNEQVSVASSNNNGTGDVDSTAGDDSASDSRLHSAGTCNAPPIRIFVA